jgi:hypothetical protein
VNAHPIAALMPAMSADDYARLRDDIKGRGLLEPIVLYEGLILDGRHRFTACTELHIEPKTTTYSGSDPVGFVYSKNVAHRHLTKGQLAMIAAKMKGFYSEQAKARMLAGKHPVGNSAQGRRKARDEAGKVVGVCGTSVDEAEYILRHGVPTLVAKVEAGEVSINEGRKVAAMRNARQEQIMSMPNAKTRQHAIAKSNAITKSKSRPSAMGDSRVPGTPLVKALLARLEIVTGEIERSGLSPEQFAEAFLREFDWRDGTLTRRLQRSEPAIRCISKLAIMAQRARKEAA